MRPVFSQLRGQDYNRSRLGSVADIETMNLAKRSIDDPGLHNTNASAWTAAKAVKALNSDATSTQELRDLENHPIPSEAFIRMDRSFTVASHGSPA